MSYLPLAVFEEEIEQLIIHMNDGISSNSSSCDDSEGWISIRITYSLKIFVKMEERIKDRRNLYHCLDRFK